MHAHTSILAQAERVSGQYARLNALTVDVEDYYHVAALSSVFSRTDWANVPPRVEDNTRRLLDIFDGAGVRGTFFVLGWVAERFPLLIKDIHQRGHEVASHGLSHTLIYEQTPEEFESETIKSKQILEQLIGAPVWGYRAASYSITKQSLWALDIIVAAGFRYDSSIFPVRHDLYGIPDSRPTPHTLRTGSGAEIVEFPPTTIRLFGNNFPVGGGGYFRLYPYWLTRYLLNRINVADNASFIFYLHPWEIDPDQPRVQASLVSRFRHYLNLHRTEMRLGMLLRDFRFGTVTDVLKSAGFLTNR
jgi:polysaccharide deacetylase family protein (PEP-CTERM system associated)